MNPLRLTPFTSQKKNKPATVIQLRDRKKQKPSLITDKCEEVFPDKTAEEFDDQRSLETC